MNLVLQLLLATLLIAGMICLRMATRRNSEDEGECGQAGCCRGYDIGPEPGRRNSRGA